jgi:hypothetical protein
VIEKSAKHAGLSTEGRRSWLGSYEAGQFLRSLWKNAAKWPMGTGNLQSAVYECVPADDETMATVYGSTNVATWRRMILYSSTPRDRKTLDIALQDRDDWCRQTAYERIGVLDEKQLKAVLQGTDEAALAGLADNRVIPEPRQHDIHRRARARLKELGKLGLQAYDDFDMFGLEAEREAQREAVANPSMRQLYRRMRRTERTLAEVKGTLERMSSFYSFYWLLLVAAVIGFVTVMLPEWIAWVRAFFR